MTRPAPEPDDVTVAADVPRAWIGRLLEVPARVTAVSRLDSYRMELSSRLDAAFRQPAVVAMLDRSFEPPTDARLAARGLLLQPSEPEMMTLEVRSLLGLFTMQFFAADRALFDGTGADELSF